MATALPDHSSSEAVIFTATARLRVGGCWLCVRATWRNEARPLAGCGRSGVVVCVGALRRVASGRRASPGWTRRSPTVDHVARAAPRGSGSPVCPSGPESARTPAPTVGLDATGAAPTKSWKYFTPPPARCVGHRKQRSLCDRKGSEPSDAISTRPSGYPVGHRPSSTEQVLLPGDGVSGMCG